MAAKRAAKRKKEYVLCAHFDPNNPLDKIDIDTINSIRELYRMNKRQLVSALLGLYRNCLDGGVEYPLSNRNSRPFSIRAKQTVTQESNHPSSNNEIVNTQPQDTPENTDIGENSEDEMQEEDLDIQTMENYDPGLFGPSFPD